MGWSEAEAHAREIASRAIKQESFDWLRDGGLEYLVEIYLEHEGLKLNLSSKGRLKKLTAHQCSKQILQTLAKQQSIELIGLKCKTSNQFIVHDFMNPWVLMEEHAGHLHHPIKDYEFWYSRPHREWVDEMIELDTLVPDLLRRFDEEYKDWKEQEYIKCVASQDEFPRSAVYSVRAAT